MKKTGSLLAALMMALGFAAYAGVPAQAAGIPQTRVMAAKPTMASPFARERVQRGDVDVDQWHIEHVYEVQLRLQRLGLLDATPNGTFGPVTERGVKRFQRKNHLAVTGVVNYKTWVKLIRKSLRGRKAVPDQCKNKGWHACYDRKWHQVNLYHSGELLNSWLVRGGDYDKQTRLGDYSVTWRDEDHYSATFDNAPMPYSQFFSGGQALHGSRYMMNPYEGHSHGCVNFYVEDARQLWKLTSDKKLRVHVYGSWD